ncbi:hypothetical protein QR680_013929 [Steinernema hermaphroditum]|uniref:Uncharacterized protein n=1 Tax=Steinernema hermaphroditum TaxID=289476 RepID=A0AA39M3C6_9BILA|nr:hypothetical protein QR680_013929 [Steinernema hermaphroditum]
MYSCDRLYFLVVFLATRVINVSSADCSSLPTMLPEDVTKLKADLRLAAGNLTQFSTPSIDADLESYQQIAHPLTFFYGACAPTDDEELETLMTNMSVQYKMILDHVNSTRISNLLKTNCFPSYMPREAWKQVVYQARLHSFFYSNYNNRSLINQRTFRAFCPVLQVEITVIGYIEYMSPCLTERNYTYPFYKMMDDYFTVATEILSIALLSQGYVTEGDAEEWRRMLVESLNDDYHLPAAHDVRANLRTLCYENALIAFENRTRDIIQEELNEVRTSLNVEALHRKIDLLRSTDYSYPRENYGVLVWNDACRVESSYIVVSNTSYTRIISNEQIKVVIHRTKNHTVGNQISEQKKKELQKSLDVETEGGFVVGVDSNTAKRNVERMMKIHDFQLVGVLVFEATQKNCFALSKMENLIESKAVKTGVPLMKSEKNYHVLVVFGI